MQLQNFNNFSRKFRLKGIDIRAFFRTSRSERIILNGIKFYLKKNYLNHFRLGIIITKKYGNSVERNRVKRLIREIFRKWKTKYLLSSDGFDIIVKLEKPADTNLIENTFNKFLENFYIQ